MGEGGGRSKGSSASLLSNRAMDRRLASDFWWTSSVKTTRNAVKFSCDEVRFGAEFFNTIKTTCCHFYTVASDIWDDFSRKTRNAVNFLKLTWNEGEMLSVWGPNFSLRSGRSVGFFFHLEGAEFLKEKCGQIFDWIFFEDRMFFGWSCLRKRKCCPLLGLNFLSRVGGNAASLGAELLLKSIRTRNPFFC